MNANDLAVVVEAVNEVQRRTGAAIEAMSVRSGYKHEGVVAEVSISDVEFDLVGFDDIEMVGKALRKATSVQGSAIRDGVVFFALTSAAANEIRSSVLV
jgi:formylmethanofuran dehydrogenase subunit A